MKKLSDLVSEMTQITQAENGQTSLSPHEDIMQPSTIKCFDPENPEYPCPLCGGLGFYKKKVEVGHPDFGKFFRCENNPVEKDLDHQDRLRKISNLEAFRDKHFDNFDVSFDQSLEYALQKAKEFVVSLDSWILFEGKYGCGKTHLAAAIGNQCLAHAINVLFLTTPDLLDHLRATFNPSSVIAYDELFERVKSIDVLILDDLGVENPSPWAQEKLFQILNHRYSHRLPTIITTNVDINDLDPRISSRLQDGNLIQQVPITAPDYRKGFEFQPQSDLTNLTLYREMTFETFNVNAVNSAKEYDILNGAVKRAEEFIDNSLQQIRNQTKRGKPWLLYMGPSGCGKTHLAAATANLLRQNGEVAMFVTATDLLDHLRTTFNPDSKIRFDKIFEAVRRTQILILDDLNTQYASPWAKEKLFQLLDYRYLLRTPTLVTSIQRLHEMDARLQTRFGDIRVCASYAIELKGHSERMKTRRNR